MKIYHNPRCRKSREGIEYLTQKKASFEIINYMNEGISESKMKKILLDQYSVLYRY